MTQRTPISDLIVVIPGISGSVLEQAGHVVWDKSWRTARKLLMADECFLQSLTLDNTSRPNQSEPMTATGLISGPSIIPGLERLGGYSRIANWLNQTFALVRDTPRGAAPPNYFEFAYDWRLDNRENARLLERFVDPRLHAWRNHSGVRDARVIIFAHSMGGLVARYYTEVLEGWRNCRLLVTLGTPHRGAAGALQALMSGYRGLPARVTETLRTFPSVYQLLPRYDFIEDERTSSLSRTHTGRSLPGVDQAQATDAHEFHLEIERAARANSMHDEYHEVYQVVPVIGTHQSTPQKLVITRDAYTMSSGPLPGMPAALADGDGTVPSCFRNTPRAI